MKLLYFFRAYYVLPLLLASLGANPLFAQSSGNVKGKITNTLQEPLVGINVSLTGTSFGDATDLKGEYFLESVPAGKYSLHISGIGFEKAQQEIVVEGGKTVSFNFILNEMIQQLAEVTVKGAANDYEADFPSQTLRIQGPLLEAPQNIQVITGQLISDQQSIDMLENVSRNVSGVQMIEHWGNFARVNMRGFKIPAFRNGMNVDLPWGPLAEDMSIVERIEFVKGPAGFMLSSGEPGGLYNVVTKKPSLIQENEVTLTVGSFNTLRSTVDVGGKVNEEGNLLYRLNVMGLTKGAHRDYEFNNRYTIAPSLKYQLNDRTSVTGEYIYQYSQMSLVGSAYVFSPGGFADLPRDFTLAEPNIDPAVISEHNVFLNIQHQLSENWQLTAQLGYLLYNQEGSSLWAENVQENGDLDRTISTFDAMNESKLGQVFVNGELLTGSVEHKILAGLDMGHKDFYADWWQGGSIDGDTQFNVYDPQYGIPASNIPVFDRSQSIRKRATSGTYPATQGQRYSSVYLQDQLAFFNNKARLTLAGRFTSFNGWSYGNSTDDQVFSPRLGLSVTVAKNTSLYGVYDQSFLPQTGTDYKGDAFVPVRASNLEAGLKREWAGGRWSSTLAVYQITKENVVVGHPDPAVLEENPYAQIQLGEVQSKGIEFDVQGEIVRGLRLIFNYANTNVEITEDTNESMVGTRVAGHARHMTNSWLHYQFENTALKGVGLSLGYQYQIDRSSWNWGADNESMLPDYFRLDGAISWQNDDVSLGLNVNNLLDEYLYSGSGYENFYYWQAEPGRNFRLNVGYKF